jgi:hypothetical protein
MTKPSKRKPTWRRSVLAAGGLFGLLAVLIAVDRILVNPWSFSLTGEPTLTGHWQGEVHYPANIKKRFVLHIGYHMPNGHCGGGCSNIDGRAKECGPGGNQSYEVWGDTENHRGTRFTVHLRADNDRQPGPRVNGFDGRWHGDELSIDATFARIYPDGSARSSTGEQNTLELTLRRSDESTFDQTC